MSHEAAPAGSPADPSAERLPPPSAYAGILLCTVGVLMQEILLTRIFSFTIWYHLAYLTISTALLGFGAAGSVLARFPSLAERDPWRTAALSAVAAGVSLLVALALLGPNPVDPQILRKDPGSLFVGLLGYYVAVAVPFFFAGLAIATPLTACPSRANRLYAADLLGAGLGCIAAVASLTWLDGPACLAVCAAVLLAGGACYAPRTSWRAAIAAGAVALLAAVPFADRAIVLVPTTSKALGMVMDSPQFESLFSRWSPVNRVDLYRVGDNRGGFWGALGLSQGYRGPRPRTLSIQYDGHNGTDIFEWRDEDSLQMLDHHVLRTPYVVAERERVVIIGVGGGIDVMNALRNGAGHVTGVDLQPLTIQLHGEQLAEWTGGTFQRPEVRLVGAEGRHWVRSSDETFDLLQITAVDTFSAQTTGAYVLAESYLYTVDAFEDYLAHLDDDGVISVIIGDLATRGLPAPLVARLALVGREALERAGATDPRRQLLVVSSLARANALDPDSPVRGSFTQNLLVKKTPFTDEEVARVRRFAERHGFDVRMAPDGGSDGALEHLVLPPPERLDTVLAAAPFVLGPVTDDKPFFFNVVRWRSLFAGADIFWQFPGSATGLLVLAMMLVQALVLGAVLILLPLSGIRTGGVSLSRLLRYLLYFIGLGVGFMLVEISFVQKYVLVLGYPTYSLSVTIFSLLVFAAVGAWLCRFGWSRPRRFLVRLLAALAALVIAEVLLLPVIRDAVLAASLPVRIGVTVLLQLPLGLALGMFFPTGLELARQVDVRLIPWAWAVNGVSSVTGTVLAVILGIELGFSTVALIAVALYAIGTLALVSTLAAEPEGA